MAVLRKSADAKGPHVLALICLRLHARTTPVTGMLYFNAFIISLQFAFFYVLILLDDNIIFFDFVIFTFIENGVTDGLVEVNLRECAQLAHVLQAKSVVKVCVTPPHPSSQQPRFLFFWL